MKSIYLAFAASVSTCALSPAFAQDVAAPAPTPVVAEQPASAAAPAAAAASPSNLLLSGTEVHMVTRTALDSRHTHLGDRFELEVSADVSAGRQIVIPAGSVATGEVTRVRKKGMWGRSGILETRLVSVRVGDRQIRLHGAAGDHGRGGTLPVVGAVLLSPLIVAPFVGFFITGHSAVIPAHTATVAYTDEDVPLAVADAGGTASDATVAGEASLAPAAASVTPRSR